jgi:hypothetical protein
MSKKSRLPWHLVFLSLLLVVPSLGGILAARSAEAQTGYRARLFAGLIRGTVGGNGTILSGSGFTVSTVVIPTSPTCPQGVGPFFKYTVTFETPFASPPTVTLAVHGFWPSQPVHVIAIDDGAGGITASQFTVYIVDPASGTCGSQNWDFIAVGRS